MGILRGSLLLLVLVTGGQAAVKWNEILRQPHAWYGATEARAVADNILAYQTPSGGWPKNTDMTQPPAPKPPGAHEEHADTSAATIDNGGTTTEIIYLARLTSATGEVAYREAVLRGLDYLCAAQYANGGWPQFFPLRPGYYTHITYNDNATANVLNVLRDVAAGRDPYVFVDAPRRTKAAAAVAKALDCILRTQVKQDGKLTVWCAQHDETTLAPAWARNFEPPSLSGSESVGLVKFLMGVEHPSPEIIAAVEGAVKWFGAVAIRGLRTDDTPGPDGKKDRHAVADPAARVIWARFYELGTNKPVFTGRDKVIRYDFNEIERERRAGYAYFGDWPANLIEKDYPRWRAKHKLP
jgi:PelA/Pel-15E family pectate lyase